jgi:hypothetical protein
MRVITKKGRREEGEKQEKSEKRWGKGRGGMKKRAERKQRKGSGMLTSGSEYEKY